MVKKNDNLALVVSMSSISLSFFLFVLFVTDNLNLAISNFQLFYSYMLAVIIIVPVGLWFLRKKIRTLYGLVFILGISFAVMIPIATYGEYVPRHSQQTLKTVDDMSILLNRISPVVIPIRNSIMGEHINTTVTIYKNNPDINIKSVNLNSTGDTILTSNNGTFRLMGNDGSESYYSLQVYAQHTGQILNNTDQYEILVYYYANDTDTELKSENLSFDWPVKTMDLSVLAYLWIVMIGVITSRLISLMLVKMDPNNPKPLKEIRQEDSLWIIFSFIIAVLIFSTFKSQTQTQLTSSTIANISIAFGFGFGFDKVLEVAQRFQKLVT
jgi:hypothetical protein